MCATPNSGLLPSLTDEDLAKVEEFASQKKTAVLVILFEDMSGSTALKQRFTEQDGEQAFQKLRQEHDELVAEAITREGAGEVVKSTGDGVLAVFAEPSAAVERALEIQEQLHTHPYISVRIGLDMGQVRVEAAGGIQKDMFGRHVDWAARAQSLAEPRHICVTRSVYVDAFGWIPKRRVSWKSHGLHCVKEGEESLDLYEPYNANLTGPMGDLRGDNAGGPAEGHGTTQALEQPMDAIKRMVRKLSFDYPDEVALCTTGHGTDLVNRFYDLYEVYATVTVRTGVVQLEYQYDGPPAGEERPEFWLRFLLGRDSPLDGCSRSVRMASTGGRFERIQVFATGPTIADLRLEVYSYNAGHRIRIRGLRVDLFIETDIAQGQLPPHWEVHPEGYDPPCEGDPAEPEPRNTIPNSQM